MLSRKKSRGRVIIEVAGLLLFTFACIGVQLYFLSVVFLAAVKVLNN